jgi:hypothetical protein
MKYMQEKFYNDRNSEEYQIEILEMKISTTQMKSAS